MKFRVFYRFPWVVYSLLLLMAWGSCQKDDLLESPVDLHFSTDTILFDTLFTTIGSSTRSFKVYNPEKDPIRISRITLAGGSNSSFRINVNGMSGTDFKEVKLGSEDSLFIFVEVTVDPNSTDQPMIITDSIVFNTHGHIQDIKLVAWGQDANFIVANRHVQGLPPYYIVAKKGEHVVWDSPKPYVIYGYAVVDSTASLTITEGTRVHFHASSGLWVYKGGSLTVDGSQDLPVHFQGDRPEPYYQDIPGQWDRIWLNEGSINNQIRHAIIENGFIGIQAETLNQPMGNSLILENVIIRNMTGMGILGRNYSISAENIQVSNCGNYAVALTNGGDYTFHHLTVANIWTGGIRQTPSVYVNNFFEDYEGTVHSNDLLAAFGNSIIHGNQDNEFAFDNIDNGTLLNFTLDHCMVKTTVNTSGPEWINCLINKNPRFEDPSSGIFRLTDDSPAIDAGNPAIQVPFDLEGNPRGSTPDMGAHEYVP